jgi:CRISPR-associated protein Cmr2
MNRREDAVENASAIVAWLDEWEDWCRPFGSNSPPLGASSKDLGDLLRFTAFWIDKRVERYQWLTQQ